MSDLTPEEQAILEKLSPVKQVVPPTFNWGEDFQRQMLAFLICNRSFYARVGHLVDSDYFVNEVHKKVFKLVSKYYEDFQSPPNRVYLEQILLDSLKGKEEATKTRFLIELNVVYHFYVTGLDTDKAYIDKLSNFARTQAVRSAFHKCAEFLNREPDDEPTWEKIRKSLEESLLVGQKLESGLDYFNEAEERYARMEENKLKGEIFTSAFGAIDNKLNSGGPTRGEMYAWVGSPGTGKSLLLVAGAIANLNRGKKVLYISLEMSEDKVAERFDTQITNPIGILDIDFRNLHQNKKDVLEALSNYVSDAVDKSLLVIKQFPGGEMGVPEYKAYLAQLKTAKGFIPDLVIIDYIGEMKDYPGKPIHQSRYEIVRDLRGHAVSEKYLIFTALQPNKFAREVQELTEIDDDNVGDSYAQSKPLDGSWSINQNRDEKEARIARVFVMKARDGESRYRFYVEYKEKTNRICEISFEEYNSRYIAQNHKKEVRDKENTALEVATSKAKKKKGNSANQEFADKLGISIDDIPK